VKINSRDEESLMNNDKDGGMMSKDVRKCF
jgi:hypothetical protein